MDWKEYEIYITKHFQKLFPQTSIQHNVRREGLMSKTKRQIDILIEGKVAGDKGAAPTALDYLAVSLLQRCRP